MKPATLFHTMLQFATPEVVLSLIVIASNV
jgi:hypothetical protein